jgi:hypothetical protein
MVPFYVYDAERQHGAAVEITPVIEDDAYFMVTDELKDGTFVIDGQDSVFDGQDGEGPTDVSGARFAIKHPVVVAMLLIVLVAFGGYSLYDQNIAFMIDINLPSIIVYTIYPGAAAKDVERDVTKILEDQFVTLPNYKSMDSVSQDSVSFIQVYYQDDVDPYDQLQEIRYRISTLENQLPDNLQGEPQALVGAAR